MLSGKGRELFSLDWIGFVPCEPTLKYFYIKLFASFCDGAHDPRRCAIAQQMKNLFFSLDA